MRIGSLFSGIGGLELGLERAGVGDVVWQVEREPFCQTILAKHWPNTKRFDDVRTVGAHNLEPVDVICGGFPCQDISYAGKGLGLSGERSGLWYEVARIVGEMGPRFVVVENVAAILSRGLGDVLGTLSDLGYDAQWRTIRASDVGARIEESDFLLWPTPTATEPVGAPNTKQTVAGKRPPASCHALKTVVVGVKDGVRIFDAPLHHAINPAWAESLMGFPDGWTDGPPVRESRKSHGKRLGRAKQPPTEPQD